MRKDNEREAKIRAELRRFQTGKILDNCVKYDKVYSTSAAQAIHLLEDELVRLKANEESRREVLIDMTSAWLKERGWYQWYNLNNWCNREKGYPENGLPAELAVLTELGLTKIMTGPMGVMLRIK